MGTILTFSLKTKNATIGNKQHLYQVSDAESCEPLVYL